MSHINILGLNISTLSMAETIDTIERWIREVKSRYVCACPVSTIIKCQHDKDFLEIVNSAGLATPDGMPLVWLSKLKGNRNAERVYGPDLMLAFCKLAQSRGYSNFFYGGKESVPEKLAMNLQQKFPRLKISGTFSPPFRELTDQEDNQIVEMINRAKPDVVWVGIGSPKQERWMAQHLDKINAAVMIGVGAAFDFISGTKKQAPKWMQKSGLEWMFRLITEPKRLWKRYLFGNPKFIYLLIKESLCTKKRKFQP